MKRLAVRLSVVLTALLCLGVFGYAGQVWWAKRTSSLILIKIREPAIHSKGPYVTRFVDDDYVSRWKDCPWYGQWHRGAWLPRRAYYEKAMTLTGQSLPNSPIVWQAWFKAHPDLVWDRQQMRLVETPMVVP